MAAQNATIEILRRSGVPIASVNGPLMAAPDLHALANVPVYAELSPVLARNTPDAA